MNLRFARKDWLGLGEKLLMETGPAALTVEQLTAAAHRTRGSFYHHFTDREAFLLELVAAWRRRSIDEPAAVLACDPSPSGMRAFLREMPFAMDHGFERALRLLAASEPAVHKAVAEVDRERVIALATLIRMLRPEVSDPMSVALVQYAVIVGTQWLIENPEDPRLGGVRAIAYQLFRLEMS